MIEHTVSQRLTLNVPSIIAVHGLDSVDASGRCSTSSWRESSKEPGEFWLVALIRDHGLGARARLLVQPTAKTAQMFILLDRFRKPNSKHSNPFSKAPLRRSLGWYGNDEYWAII